MMQQGNALIRWQECSDDLILAELELGKKQLNENQIKMSNLREYFYLMIDMILAFRE